MRRIFLVRESMSNLPYSLQIHRGRVEKPADRSAGSARIQRFFLKILTCLLPVEKSILYSTQGSELKRKPPSMSAARQSTLLNIDGNKAERVSSGIPHDNVAVVFSGFTDQHGKKKPQGNEKGTETQRRNRKDPEKTKQFGKGRRIFSVGRSLFGVVLMRSRVFQRIMTSDADLLSFLAKAFQGKTRLLGRRRSRRVLAGGEAAAGS